uniref:Uncharacterized protein n=2 Tax=Lygus hesperus TaxID=30085 RepID=A0A0K8SN92_LYGHE
MGSRREMKRTRADSPGPSSSEADPQTPPPPTSKESMEVQINKLTEGMRKMERVIQELGKRVTKLEGQGKGLRTFPTPANAGQASSSAGTSMRAATPVRPAPQEPEPGPSRRAHQNPFRTNRQATPTRSLPQYAHPAPTPRHRRCEVCMKSTVIAGGGWCCTACDILLKGLRSSSPSRNDGERRDPMLPD